MNTFMVEYVLDRTLKVYTMLVSAADYTEAYISALLTLPYGTIITELFVI